MLKKNPVIDYMLSQSNNIQSMKGYTNIPAMYFSYQYPNTENRIFIPKHFIDVICYSYKLCNAKMIIKKPTL